MHYGIKPPKIVEKKFTGYSFSVKAAGGYQGWKGCFSSKK
jgi:hypothetical protein